MIMAIEDASESKINEIQYRAGVMDLLGRTLTLYYHGLTRFIVLFGIGLMAISFVLSALLTYLFLNPELMFFISFDGFGFVLRIPAVTDLIIFNVLAIIFSTIIWSIIEAPTTEFALEMYEQHIPTVQSSIDKSRSRIGALLKVRLIILFIELAITIPILSILVLGINLGDVNLLITAEMMSFVIVFVIGYIHVRFLPIAPIVLREDFSARDALQRSFNLSAGQFLHMTGGFFALLFFEFMLFFFFVNVFSIFGYGTIAILFPFYFSYLFVGSLRPLFSVVLYKDLLSRM
jgi:hypothetical protein